LSYEALRARILAILGKVTTSVPILCLAVTYVIASKDVVVAGATTTIVVVVMVRIVEELHHLQPRWGELSPRRMRQWWELSPTRRRWSPLQ
jgi:hypothetical protein